MKQLGTGTETHIRYPPDYLQQQDGECGIESKHTTVCVFIVMKEYVTQRLSDVFLIVFGQQWSSLAQRN